MAQKDATKGEEAMRMMRQAPIARRDILPTTDPAVSEALFRAFLEESSLVEPARRDKHRQLAQNSTRFAERIGFVEPLSNDPTGYERVIGESDLTSINYMDRGRRAANSVCRIRVPEAGGECYGTAFLAGPRLLVTNHHVLGSASEASRAEAEFGYEHDIDGVLIPPTSFNLAPHELFFTSAALDITFVAVSPVSDAGVPLDRYGWLALLPLSGKSIDREWIT